MNNRLIISSLIGLGLILTLLFARRGASAAPPPMLQQTNREEEMGVAEIPDTAFRRIVEEYEARPPPRRCETHSETAGVY